MLAIGTARFRRLRPRLRKRAPRQDKSFKKSNNRETVDQFLIHPMQGVAIIDPPYSVAGLTLIVQRTRFFAFVANVRLVSIASRLPSASGEAATIKPQLSGADACIKRCPASHADRSFNTRVAMRSGQCQLVGIMRAIGPATNA